MPESTMSIDVYGDKAWTNSDGDLHRTDGPAVEYLNGDKAWWVRGKRHRTDGPAIEFSNGDKEWYVNGNLHRIDGPAVEWSNGDKVWWVEGELLGYDDSGFWALWDCLSDEDRANPTLLSHLPGGFNV
jgi:hypothetical protein